MSKKKTAARRALEGTLRSDRFRKTIFGGGRPTPRPFLSDSALKYFEMLCDHIEQTGRLHKADGFYISEAAQTLANIDRLRKMMTEGHLEEFDTTGANIRLAAYRKELNYQKKDFREYCVQLGIGLKNREAIDGFSAPVETEENDPFADAVVRPIRKVNQ